MDQIIVDRQIRRRRTRRRGIVALLGAASLLTVGAGSISLAQFTDSDASTWAFTAGTIDISTSPTVLTAVSGMMPGDNATQALTVTNGGSGDLRYAITVAATNPLGTALQLTIKGPDGGVGSSCTLFNGASILAATTLNSTGPPSAIPPRAPTPAIGRSWRARTRFSASGSAFRWRRAMDRKARAPRRPSPSTPSRPPTTRPLPNSPAARPAAAHHGG
jgi:hypothetical protein